MNRCKNCNNSHHSHDTGHPVEAHSTAQKLDEFPWWATKHFSCFIRWSVPQQITPKSPLLWVFAWWKLKIAITFTTHEASAKIHISGDYTAWIVFNIPWNLLGYFHKNKRFQIRWYAEFSNFSKCRKSRCKVSPWPMRLVSATLFLFHLLLFPRVTASLFIRKGIIGYPLWTRHKH